MMQEFLTQCDGNNDGGDDEKTTFTLTATATPAAAAVAASAASPTYLSPPGTEDATNTTTTVAAASAAAAQTAADATHDNATNDDNDDDDDAAAATGGGGGGGGGASAGAGVGGDGGGCVEEEKSLLEEYSQKYVYRFDDPSVQDCAFVHVMNNKIIVQFPIKPDYTQYYQPMHNVQLYVNRQLIFHSNWLPVQTLQDQFKFKNMFHQIWHEYTLMTDNDWKSSLFAPFINSECITTVNKPSYKLTCIENYHSTLLELDTKTVKFTTTAATASSTVAAAVAVDDTRFFPSSTTPHPPPPPPPSHPYPPAPIHIKFYFGPHLVLCSESVLQHLDSHTLHFLLSFILQKLLN